MSIPSPTPSPISSPLTGNQQRLPRSLSDDELNLLSNEGLPCQRGLGFSPKFAATQTPQLKLPLKAADKKIENLDLLDSTTTTKSDFADIDDNVTHDIATNGFTRLDTADSDQLGNEDLIFADRSSGHLTSISDPKTLKHFISAVYFRTVFLLPRQLSFPSSQVIIVYVALFAAQVFWSGFHVAGKYAFDYISPEVLPTFRALGAVPIFYFLGVYEHGWNFHVLSWTDHKWMMLMGLLGSTIPQQCFNLGLLFADASIGGMIQPIIPICTTIAAIALRREIFTWGKAGGVVLAMAGSIVMIIAESAMDTSVSGAGVIGDDGNSNSGNLAILGTLLFVFQCVITSAYIILQKPLFVRISVNAFTFWLFVYGGIGHFCVGVFFLPSQNWSEMPLLLIPIIMYTIVFASVAAFMCFVYATKHLPASISSLGICVQSVASPILGAMFLDESVSLLQGFGGVLIVAGIICVVWAKTRENKIIPIVLDELNVMKDSKDDQGHMDDDTNFSDDDSDGSAEYISEDEEDVEGQTV